MVVMLRHGDSIVITAYGYIIEYLYSYFDWVDSSYDTI